MNTTPTIKKLFLNSLKRGTGEAYLLTQTYPSIDFTNLIIKGAVKNYAYDGQSESSRAEYISDLIATSGKQNTIRNAILKALAKEQDDSWTLTHLFALAKQFALQGDQGAKQAIYDRFMNHPIAGAGWIGYSEIVELDGMNGLFFIAEKFGIELTQNPDSWQDDSIVSEVQRNNPDLNIWEELEKKSKSNKNIRVYLDAVRSNQNLRNKDTSEPPKYTEIVEEIIAARLYPSYFRNRVLTEFDLKIIADKLISEEDISKKEKLLYVFRTHKFPLDSTFILNLAKQKSSRKNRLNEFALDALQHLKSSEIRQYAIEQLSESKHPEDYVGILVSNFEEGDDILLAEIADKTTNKHSTEQLNHLFIKIFQQHKTKGCKIPIELLYSKTTCGLCRQKLIEVLIENKALSEQLNAEIKYDSNPDTRKLAS